MSQPGGFAYYKPLREFMTKYNLNHKRYNDPINLDDMMLSYDSLLGVLDMIAFVQLYEDRRYACISMLYTVMKELDIQHKFVDICDTMPWSINEFPSG
jgi:hypothetical protein